MFFLFIFLCCLIFFFTAIKILFTKREKEFCVSEFVTTTLCIKQTEMVHIVHKLFNFSFDFARINVIVFNIIMSKLAGL